MRKGREAPAIYVVTELIYSERFSWERLNPRYYCDTREEAAILTQKYNAQSPTNHRFIWSEVPRAPDT